MPLLNNILDRDTEVEKKTMDEIVTGVSREMKLLFKGKKNSLEELVTSSFALGIYYAQSFRLRCCTPKKQGDIEKVLMVHNYVTDMSGECVGALDQEIVKQFGKKGEGAAQKLMQLAIDGKHTREESIEIIFNLINKKEENE